MIATQAHQGQGQKTNDPADLCFNEAGSDQPQIVRCYNMQDYLNKGESRNVPVASLEYMAHGHFGELDSETKYPQKYHHKSSRNAADSVPFPIPGTCNLCIIYRETFSRIGPQRDSGAPFWRNSRRRKIPPRPNAGKVRSLFSAESGTVLRCPSRSARAISRTGSALSSASRRGCVAGETDRGFPFRPRASPGHVPCQTRTTPRCATLTTCSAHSMGHPKRAFEIGCRGALRAEDFNFL